MNELVLDTALRTALTFFLVLVLCRFMGRKLMSQMTFFDFVVGISLGSVSANLALGPKPTVISAITVLVMFAALTIGIGFWHIKKIHVRKAVDSEPTVMVANGKIVEENMKKTRLALSELLMLLREKNVFNIADVEFALMETDGKLSVLPKSQNQPVTPADLKLGTVYKGLVKDLIMDGTVLEENLRDTGLDGKWLSERMDEQGISHVKEVFYAGLDTSGNLFISVKETQDEKHGKYGIE